MTEQTQKPFTWADLKRVVNNLPEEFLTEPVLWWGEERGGKINCIRLLDETYVKTDEGYEPLSAQETNEEDADLNSWYEGSELQKGHPIIDVD